jgi:hypothetical protein
MDDNELYKTILRLKDEINDCKNAQREKNDLYTRTSYKISSPVQQRFIDKMNNPLIGPEIEYHGGSFSTPPFDAYQNYQKLGFISNATGQFPIYGRQKYQGRSDRMEYFTINEGRNSVKIPIKTTNYTELYDKDPINIPELGGDSVFTKYENEGMRYNPNIF